MSNYPTTPIGGGNPYSACSSCGRSQPEISNHGHYASCEWEKSQKSKSKHDAFVDAIRKMAEQAVESDVDSFGPSEDSFWLGAKYGENNALLHLRALIEHYEENNV